MCHNQEVQCEQATLQLESILHCKGERKCVVAKKEEDRDTADKNFETLLNRFGLRITYPQRL